MQRPLETAATDAEMGAPQAGHPSVFMNLDTPQGTRRIVGGGRLDMRNFEKKAKKT
jgi:hypothetical protein